MIILIDNYDSFAYNLYQLLASLGEDVMTVRNDRIAVSDIEELSPEAIVISPGPGRPADAGISEQVIRRFSGSIPILGVCLGHQAIAEVHHTPIVHAPSIMHGKMSEVIHCADPIFAGIPERFPAARYHSLVADRERISGSLELIAWTEDGTVMALKVKDSPVYGLQFHPESILTPSGDQIIRNFLSLARR